MESPVAALEVWLDILRSSTNDKQCQLLEVESRSSDCVTFQRLEPGCVLVTLLLCGSVAGYGIRKHTRKVSSRHFPIASASSYAFFVLASPSPVNARTE